MGVEKTLPTGTVTFLLTDIEGSTKLWQWHEDLMGRVVARHDEIIAKAVADHGGVLVKRGSSMPIGEAIDYGLAGISDGS